MGIVRHKLGSPGWTRTTDLRCALTMLYLLSYREQNLTRDAGIEPALESLGDLS